MCVLLVYKRIGGMAAFKVLVDLLFMVGRYMLSRFNRQVSGDFFRGTHALNHW